jgi:ribosome recycling factor
MTTNQILTNCKDKFSLAFEHFTDELKKIHTGRAHPSMLDGVKVEAYGVEMPLIQVGTITVPEAQLLQITPFDPGNIAAIATAIRNNQSLGMNPMDDGKVVRVPVPPLTEERRREYAKLVSAKHEEAMITLRNIRHDAIKTIDQAKKDKTMSEDDAKRLQQDIEKDMNDTRSRADTAAKQKEQEIMTV